MIMQVRNSLFRASIIALICSVSNGIYGVQALTRGQMTPEQKEAVALTSRYIKGRFDAVNKLRKEGNVKAAEAAYELMLKDRLTRPFPAVRLGYADLLDSEGRLSDAMHVVSPLVFTKSGSSDFRAVSVYERDLLKLHGQGAVKAFHDQIRGKTLNGFSLRDFNNRGLTDEQAMIFVEGSNAEGKGKYAEAERLYRKIVPAFPPSMLLFSQMDLVLNQLHRGKEVKPLLESWYLHSSPQMQKKIKQHYDLDYKRLDAMVQP